MRSFRKIIAVLVTLSMLLGAVSLTASAGEAPIVVLRGRTQLEKDDFYYADLVIIGEDVGGVQGTIKYDTNVFDYEGIEFTDDFDAVNKRNDDENVVQVNEETGTIAFIGINPGNDVVWFTLKFNTKTTTTTAVNFDINSDVIALVSATVDGKEAFTETFVDAPKGVEVVVPDQVDMMGGSIKAITVGGNQDLRFEAWINYTGDKEIEEYGVIFIPAQLLPKGAELKLGKTYGTNSQGKPIKAAVASSSKDFDENEFKLYATLTGSSSFNAGALLQIDIYARAYIKFTDGSVLYSNNDKDDTAINNGYARKSIIGIAKSMASKVVEKDNDGLVTYTEKVTNAEAVDKLIKEDVLNGEQEGYLLEFVVANKELIKKLIATLAK